MPLSTLAGELLPLLDAFESAGFALFDRAAFTRRPAAGTVSVAVGADAVALAAPAWRSLEAEGGAATPFQTLALAKHLADAHVRRGDIPRLIVVHDGARPVLILPTVVTRWLGMPTLRFLGDPLIQYGDAIARPDVRRDHLEAAWHAALDPSVAVFAHLRKVRGDARIASVAARNAAIVAVDAAPFVDVLRPHATNARDARELRRFRRRLSERGHTELRVLRGAAALPAVHEALRLKRAWLAERGLPSRVIGDHGWEAALAAIAADEGSPLRAAQLSAGGETAAVEIGLVSDGRWCAYLGALSPSFAKTGPGQVQMAETIAHCRAEGIASYDLLAPADAYKNGLSHGAVAVRDHAAVLSLAGWASLLAVRSIPALKRAAAARPQQAARAAASLVRRT